MREHQFDMFVGSVHHVHGIPIDYDAIMYEQARQVAERLSEAKNVPRSNTGIECETDSEQPLFADYFDAQTEMLEALKPPVVGHFDLIALFSQKPNDSLRRWGDRIWDRVRRNLEIVRSYGGRLEISSARLRKGKMEPYPGGEICTVKLRGTAHWYPMLTLGRNL